MNRREFIALAGGAAASPVVATAQKFEMPVIGYLSSFPISGTFSDNFVAAFKKGLAEAGIEVGRQVAIVYRSADSVPDQLRELANDLINRHVDVIVATGGPLSVTEAMAATNSIPIVFVTGGDPVRAKFVPNINRPGGNVTGVTFFSAELSAKRIEFLREMVPQAVYIGVLNDPAFPEYLDASALPGIKLVSVDAGIDAEIDSAFERFSQLHADALFVGTGPLFNNSREKIVSLAARHAIPAIYLARESVEFGGLLSYGANVPDAFRVAGTYAGRSFLKGAKAGDLPVLQPTTFELVINLKTAKALGLAVPQTLLVAATDVIE